MLTYTDDSKPPSGVLVALEARALLEFQAFFAAYPLLRLAPRGDGHPVLLLPGLATSDLAMQPMRAYLKAQGYAPHGWKQGLNRGLRPGVKEKLQARLKELSERHQSKVSIVGWSLGGIFARELAEEMPELVRQVITLGSPFTGSPKATNAWRLYEFLSGRTVEEEVQRREETSAPLLVPTTSIYSRSDGIVAWQTCIDTATATSENIEVVASHLGLGVHPAALYAIADRLALPEAEWWPFDRNGPWHHFYPKRESQEHAANGPQVLPSAA